MRLKIAYANNEGGDIMLGRDGTGPNGQGQMTGRKMGNCDKAVNQSSGRGRGLMKGRRKCAGNGLGLGRGIQKIDDTL